MPQTAAAPHGQTPAVNEVRDRILNTASALFYRLGVRAVGVDMVVAEASVAKTSLYRYFRTKDDLIAAFLQREDLEFWRVWDEVARQHAADAAAELDAHMQWIGERVGRPKYRGCPQINVAAEFPDADHPARTVARTHKAELKRRLQAIAERLGAEHPDQLGLQLAVVVNGAFVSTSLFTPENATPTLQALSRALVAAARA